MTLETMETQITNGVAVASITSPWWLDVLGQTSDVAAGLLPVLGCGWLIMQMITHHKKSRGDKE